MKRSLLAYNKCTSNKLIGSISTSIRLLSANKILNLFIAFLLVAVVNAQENKTPDPAYIKVITERSAKIVNTLSLKDSAKYYQVVSILVQQYNGINNIHEETKLALAAIKQQSITAQESALQVQKQEEKKAAQLQQLHSSFLAGLQKVISEEQIELVKDGMTYKVLHVTYDGYLDMIPTLKEDQKKKIYEWLVEARELAMDGESSDKKHAIFGKYKGRINNYLSAAGYDLTKEREAWQARIKERKMKTGN
jgi:hypothetical protein